ncbi:PREDICTED: lys-63-specific deubiquitinase BRCC36-like isoform X2 [Amphimedon queenslandica]|nr:PREDICTED: lys-63-specific deubiquitinase BRCC36-like isoform X2 [Amphimedon queenslandica]XP_019858053.1 PREDICTED: lys-63-specific deubiquitinase BRCC36-like isoform X2 [Amphimedon queenslandica]|eukprot:XP_019858052.1 PREDICTED: lys-63-specific deubiquitinase BRCC36-like isoform X2 [Amphimedon queenslandica]
MSTEREEVMGLLLGEIIEEGEVAVVQVFSLYMMRRLDKQPDRVEISPEQLSSGAIEAEALSERMNRTVQVVGWYHSHPHITVWPSHVDVRTQANYQLMGRHFVGLIFSCFEEIDKKCSTKVICFQSIPKLNDPLNYEHVTLECKVVPTVQGTVSPMASSGLIRLLNILIEEEKHSYENNQKFSNDELTLLHNGAVYVQSLSQLLQVIGAPLLQLLQELLINNNNVINKLEKERDRLLVSLSTEGESV